VREFHVTIRRAHSGWLRRWRWSVLEIGGPDEGSGFAVTRLGAKRRARRFARRLLRERTSTTSRRTGT